MTLLGIFMLLAGPALGVLWLILEFRGNRAQRITCGIFASIALAGVASLATLIVDQLSYNACYGSATKDLIDETIRGIEEGRSEVVLRELRVFQSEYHPTYENRAKYVPLAKATTERLKKENPQPAAGDCLPGSK